MKKTVSKEKNDIGIFSFFTGAGFLDLGFEDAGFKSFLANEIDHSFARVYTYSRQCMGKDMPVFGLKEIKRRGICQTKFQRQERRLSMLDL